MIINIGYHTYVTFPLEEQAGLGLKVITTVTAF